MRFLKAIVSRWNRIGRSGKIIIALLAVVMAVFVIAYFEPHKLFIDQEINEDFPGPVAVATTTTATPLVTEPPVTAASPTTTTPPAVAVATTTTAAEPEVEEEQSPGTTATAAETTTTSTTAPPTTTTTAPPTTTTTEAVPEGPVLLSSSEWISLGHPGTGTVLVYRQPDGSHVIRFEDLEVSNGPDLLVILSTSPLVFDQNAYSAVEYLSLGDLKGNKGNQNYEVPADVNVEDYQTVAIWCRRFNYTFNAADIHSLPGA